MHSYIKTFGIIYANIFSDCFKGDEDLILLTLSTSVGFAKEDDKTPDTTPQNTLITMVSSEKKIRAAIRFRMSFKTFH